MTIAIVAGPTLWDDPVLEDKRILWRPPGVCGDIYEIAARRPAAIGIIDGCFEAGPSIWHKEILWALAQGVHVFGAASLGALRAAELAPFGMVGIGAIYEDFRCGRLKDDDEVAVLHAPAELQYRPLSEAMVDIRATLAAARKAGIVSLRSSDTLLRIAKDTFFKERSWNQVLRQGRRKGVCASELERMKRWLPANRVEQKRLDALALVDRILRRVAAHSRPFRARFAFQHTQYWQAFVRTRRPWERSKSPGSY